MKIRFFISIGLLLLSYSMHGMETAISAAKIATSGACTAAHWISAFGMPIASGLFDPLKLQSHQLKDAVSNIAEPTYSFLQSLAQKREMHNIRWITKDVHDYGTQDDARIIYIPNENIDALQRCINNYNNKTLTNAEKKWLDSQIAGIHHELTHIQRQSLSLKAQFQYKAPFIVQALWTLFRITAFKKIKIDSFIANNGWKIASGILKFYLVFNLLRLYEIYDELKADDGIPSERDLLISQRDYFQHRHNNLKTVINATHQGTPMPDGYTGLSSKTAQLLAKIFGTKWCDKMPLLYDLIEYLEGSYHPSDHWRIKRFEKRMNASL